MRSATTPDPTLLPHSPVFVSPLAMLLRPDVFRDVSTVTAGFSTRHGGVSAPPYDTLNLGLHVGDETTCVEENRRRFCDALRVDPAWLVTANQVHGGTVRTVDAPQHVPFCDGLVTSTSGLTLAITAADCAVVLLVDPDADVVGACHSGWRGTVAEVAVHTVDAMVEQGAAPDRMRAYVSPCISLASFEVGEEVAAEFDDAFVHRRDDWRRPHVDLKACLQAQLTRAGLETANVEVSPRCTLAESDTFFSYRASDDGTGVMFGAIGLNP